MPTPEIELWQAGQLPYRDYFQIVTPGTDLTYALLIRWFGLRTWIPHLLMAALAAVAAPMLGAVRSCGRHLRFCQRFLYFGRGHASMVILHGGLSPSLLSFYSSPALNNWRVLLYDLRWYPGLVRWVAYPFIYATVPLAFILFLVTTRLHWRGKDRTEPWSQLVLIALTGIFMFLAIAPSPSIKRLASVGPPAMVSMTWMLCRPGRVMRLLRMGLGFGAIAIALGMPLRTQTHWRAFLDLPAGRTAFQDKLQYDEYGWVLEHSPPGQFF